MWCHNHHQTHYLPKHSSIISYHLKNKTKKVKRLYTKAPDHLQKLSQEKKKKTRTKKSKREHFLELKVFIKVGTTFFPAYLSKSFLLKIDLCFFSTEPTLLLILGTKHKFKGFVLRRAPRFKRGEKQY